MKTLISEDFIVEIEDIRLQGRSIYKMSNNGNSIFLKQYGTEKEAKEEFENIKKQYKRKNTNIIEI